MAKKGSSKAGSVSAQSNGDVAAGGGKAKKPAVSRADKAGLTMSVSKVHNHLLRHKQAKGVTRVSVSAPVWITAAIEFFAAELLEQAGNLTVKDSRKRITVEDLIKALRSDTELNRAMPGFRILAGDKIKGKKITEELSIKPKKAPVATEE